MVVRAASLRTAMSHYLVERIDETENIEVMTCTEVVAACGSSRLERVMLRDLGSGQEQSVDTSAMFIYIGTAPRSEFVADLVERDERGNILTGPDLPAVNGRPRSWSLERPPLMFETSVPGIFAAGAVRAGAHKRVAAAVGEGSAAVFSIHRYLETV